MEQPLTNTVTNTSTGSGPPRKLRVVSFDGGGVRGLSSLLILRRLMYTVNAADDLHQLPKPCEYFDMMCGTSTGGLIAIMLGRMRMGVQECIDSYCDLAQYVFQEKRGLTHSKFIGPMLGKSRFSKTRLEKILKEMVKKTTGDPDTPMFDKSPEACRVFVCATRSANTEPSLFRSYQSPDEERNDVTIWQAARATSAAPTFFSPVRLGSPAGEYVDGALVHNNPIRLLVREVQSLWGPDANLACVLSIGTGFPPTRTLGRMGPQILAACVAKATETETTARTFKSEHRHDLVKDKKYFRFNVAHGLQNVRLEEWEELDLIDATTKTYLRDSEAELRACADAIRHHAFRDIRGVSISSNMKPRYVDLLGAVSPYFIGREEPYKDLRNYFTARPRKNPQVAILTGLGGVGKTQIALHYAETHSEEYIGVFFIDATNDEELKAAFVRIARTIISEEMRRYPESNYDEIANTLGFAGLVNSPSRNPLIENYDRIVEAVKRFFSRLNSLFLLIFDGADTPEDPWQGVEKFLPYRSLGDIIITTRGRERHPYGQVFSIEGMKESSAIQLLYQTSNRIQSKKDCLPDAKRIVKELGNLPLAIELAGAYLSTSSTSFSAFLQTYRTHSKEILSSTPRAGYKRSVFATWEISFRRSQEMSPKTRHLLQTLSFMYFLDVSAVFWKPESGAVSVSSEQGSAHAQTAKSLESALGENNRDWLLSNDTYDLERAFAVLADLSMIKRIHEEEVYNIHPVVHLWARERLSLEDQSSYATDAIFLTALALHNLTGIDKLTSWTQQLRLLPHIRSCLQHARHFVNKGLIPFNHSIAAALDIYAQLYLSTGNYLEAEEVLVYLLDKQKETTPFTRKELYSIMARLAYVYDGRGRLSEAQDLLERALEGRVELLGEDDALTLETLNDLAGVYEYRGQIAKAEQMYKQALRGRERIFGLEHPDVLRTVSDLAGLCDHQGRTSEAKELHQRALVGREKVLGPNHPDTLSSVLAVGGFHWAVGELDKAEEMFERACDGRIAFFGPRHPETLFALNTQAGLLGSRGRLHRAEAMYREILEARRISLGEDHPDTLWTHNGLGGLLVNRGKLKEAEELLEKSATGLAKSLGRSHADTLWVFHNLAIVYENTGKLEEAEKLHKQAFAGYNAELGMEHPDTLWLLNDLAACYSRSGKLVEAEKTFRQAYEGKLARLGFFHPETLYTANCLAGAIWAIGGYEEAETLFVKVLAATGKIMGSTHPDTCACMDSLGAFYAEVGKLDEAERILTECYNTRANTLGSDHQQTKVTRKRLQSLDMRRLSPASELAPDDRKDAKTVPTTYGFGSRRRRDQRRWIPL